MVTGFVKDVIGYEKRVVSVEGCKSWKNDLFKEKLKIFAATLSQKRRMISLLIMKCRKHSLVNGISCEFSWRGNKVQP
jgi:hypothetical protein